MPGSLLQIGRPAVQNAVRLRGSCGVGVPRSEAGGRAWLASSTNLLFIQEQALERHIVVTRRSAGAVIGSREIEQRHRRVRFPRLTKP